MNCNYREKTKKTATAFKSYTFVCAVLGFVCAALLLLATHPVVADDVLPRSESEMKKVYIVGNPDFYPIEYYNPKKGTYEGALPMFFEELSQRLDLNFEYINGSGEYNNDKLFVTQAHIYSSHIIGSDRGRIKDEVQIFSYSYNGKKMKIGLAFSERASDRIIDKIKSESAKFTPDMLSGFLVMSIPDYSTKTNVNILVLLLVCVGLIVLLFICVRTIKHQKVTLNNERLIDAETGIGNLVHFEQKYSLIPKEKRNEYVVLYIIIEGSNLQTYHRDSAFNEALKHTADFISNYESNDGFCARATESGFILAVKTEENVIIKEICKELNYYFDQNGKEKNSFFRVAAYRLCENDNNSELVIFQLRHNCNKLIGTETQTLICDSDMTQKEAEEKIMIENIINGFENKEFQLYMQFIVDKKSKKIVSAEALSRWHKPGEGVVSPFRYIGVMEHSGLILRLDYYMFELVCQQLHRWQDTEFDGITISCNLTRITISEPDFVDRIREIAAKYIFEHTKLILEFTEDAIEKNRNIAMSNIEKCKKMGFRIALDDVGSGYTSFMNLCEYPVDVVKIDRDILLKTDTERGRDLFVGIIALAHTLGFTVVCEGVETEEQKCLVEETDCNYIQGWYYFTPQYHRDCEKIAREYPAGIKS